jgi:uncharacterized protein
VPIVLVVFFALLGVPRVVRGFLFFFIALFGGWALSSSFLVGLAAGVVAAILGFLLPVLRGSSRHRRGGVYVGPVFGGGYGGGRSGGSFGGFSGGGGGFGGGGASGRW